MAEYKYKFSVVVPVYKVEDYLRETLDSLVSQTIGFKENIQVILVNDGTPDKSGEICKEYKSRYEDNIVYIEKENGGVSSARNAGIPYIEGKYVNFLDSDDKWDENAFLNAYSFFEEHYDEIDVLSCRVKKFGSSEGWHALDFKFQSGSRIIDLSDEKDCCFVQSHVATAIIKREAITDEDLFSVGVNFGEDSMYINRIILRRLKCGVADNVVYYYRKRLDNSSATQVQNETAEYYTSSPSAYYESLVSSCQKLYGKVVPYIQNVLVYDIGWRVREKPSETVLHSPELYDSYCSLLRKYLMMAEERYIISNRVHKRIGYKVALLSLRDGTDLLDNTCFNKEKEAIFYKDMSLLRLQSKHKLCHINVCKIKKNPENGKTELIIEGLIARWVFDCCKDENITFAVKIGKKKYDIKKRDYSLIKAKSFYGESSRYDSFRKKIDLDAFLKERERIKVEICLVLSDVPYPITVNYGEFVPSADDFSSCHRAFGNYVLTCKSSHITVRKSEDIASDLQLIEERAEEKLQGMEKSEYAEMRKELLSFRKSLQGRKIWLMCDSEEKAGGNAEAFFRFTAKKSENENSELLPVFVLSEESADYERLSSFGKVISPKDSDFRSYLVSAEKIIVSQPQNLLSSYLTEDERIYLGDLIINDIVMLDGELIAKDKSETHGKFTTGTSLYCVAREKQLKSVLKNDGCYFKEEVVLTGAPKFDLYENEKEKLIVFRPHKNTDETAESFRDSRAFSFWNAVINSKKLQFNMMRHGYKGLLCLPEEYREFSELFSENPFVKVCKDETNEDAFKKGAILVTDFYPGFEFAYNEKPVIYAHYENVKNFYLNNPECKGMFNFENAGFGKICYSGEETLGAISEAMKEKAVLKDEDKERGDIFFSFKDKNNCQRVYDAIIKG